MVTARFVVQGKEQEAREVEEQWLEDAYANQDNVLLNDGNTYRIARMSYVGTGGAGYVEVDLIAPQFARAS